jgi:hypothetical protein
LSFQSLGIITIRAGTGTALAACLAGTLAAGLEAAGGSLSALGSDVALGGVSFTCLMRVSVRDSYLLVGVHAGKAAGVAGLAALGSDITDFVLGTGRDC